MKAILNTIFKSHSSVLAIIGVIVALLVHVIEIEQLHLDGHLHETADDASYQRPALNLIDNGTWKDNSIGPSSYVQRPPMTGFFHLIGVLITGRNNSIGFFALALLLHGIGIYLFHKIIDHYSNKRWAIIVTSLFILLPCFWGFLSYSISEAIALPFLLLSIYFGLIPQKQQLSKIIIALLLLYLLRPVLIVFILPLLLFHLINARKSDFKLEKKSRKIYYTLTLLILVFSFWEGRKYYYAQTFSPHPIYHVKNESYFGPAHQAMTEFYKIWEYQPEVFHEMVLLGDTSETSKIKINYYIETKNLPINAEQLRYWNDQFQKSLLYGKLKGTTQIQFAEKLNTFTHSVRSNNSIQYWIQTPYKSLQLNLFKSHLNLNLFQEKLRGNDFIEIFRYFTLVILLLGYFSLIIIFAVKTNTQIKLLSTGALVYILVLVEFQRMNEDRYFLPCAFIGFLILSILTFRLSEHFTKRQKSIS